MTELRKILYVEDEADIREVARISLEMIGGFEVSICASGEQCLELAPEVKPDLIILDVMMPGMDGPDTLQLLKSIPSVANIPVVFMTAKVQSHEMDSYRCAGVLGVIAKPFDPMTLPDRLRELFFEPKVCSV
ncbi:response regulator [Pseudohongiella spirulinae]|uniref:Response regulator receiver domain protein (CheY-like) n=1 Tax=Pseudohongiella spirulinae TaxID=1249552 RepID=A0A0S2KF74_9GAMM|nr:response regulator [Pseudohongiella spirulinae]ALO46889.1 Response regulator receiver domain protein (CheY-like) [Pseudohongiella spirulinae]